MKNTNEDEIPTYKVIFSTFSRIVNLSERMFSNALRTSIQVVKARPVVPVRTIITCTRYNRYSPVESIKHQHVMVQKRTFMGPLIRYMTQFLASIGGTSIRAFFQAFQPAAGNEFYVFIDL